MTYNGTGVTVAIVDAYASPTIVRDINDYSVNNKLPRIKVGVNFSQIVPAGIYRVSPTEPCGPYGWWEEESLDVSAVHSSAPGAKIVYVGSRDCGPTLDIAFMDAIYNRVADVITDSWGDNGEAIAPGDQQAYDQALMAAAAQGITVLFSSGDNGDLDAPNGVASGAWPSTSPWVTAVGGTRLNLDAAGHRVSPDAVWNDTYSSTANQLVNRDPGPNPLAGGGGRSSVFARPAYQNTVRAVVGNHRGLPDISMSAACTGAVSIYQSFPGQRAGWYALCGTSEATPLFAGIVALADQVAGHSLGLINPALYQLAASRAAGIVGVTAGNNTVSFRRGGRTVTVRGFSARSGYSLAAGLGTVNGASFVPELARLAGPVGR